MNQLSLFDLPDYEETDAWVKAVNEAARECDDALREELDMSPIMHLAIESPDVQKAADKFMQTASGGKYHLKDLPLITQKDWFPALSKPLKRGTKVCAKEDITFSADNTRIEAGTMGKIETSGREACNVIFEGDRRILCTWDMLLEVVKP
jgi:hypothetical protein